MKTLMKSFAFVSCLIFIAAAFSPTANADVWSKKTILTISEPIEVSKIVLDPGTYVIKLADSASDRHIIQIFNQDETHFITTVLPVPQLPFAALGQDSVQFLGERIWPAGRSARGPFGM